MYSASTSTSPFERSVAFATALSISLAIGLAAARRVNFRMLSAAPTGLPRIKDATSATFRGAIRSILRWACVSIRLLLLGWRRSRFGHLLLRRVAVEGAGWAEFAELVPHHVLRHEYRNELAAVVADELRQDGRTTGPGFDYLLLIGPQHVLHLADQMPVDERSFFD